MSELYQYIIENVTAENISKQIGAQIINLVSNDVKRHEDIAIIGMSVKLPFAENKDEFWSILAGGVDCIREFPESRRKAIEEVYSSKSENIGDIEYNVGGFLDDVGGFDPMFFKISPMEASLISPNQRLFLQTAWNVIEDAGYSSKKLSGKKVGVYVGHSQDFGLDYVSVINDVNPAMKGIATAGNIASIIASRISYILDLKGPSMLVDTACSSALVAVHLACQALRENQCEMAIVGGVKVNLFPAKNIIQSGIGIESKDGRARAFDDSSDGTGLGEGVIAVMLKPISKALRDNDNVYAIIKGSAVNQDGSSIGITAPNSLAQEDAILSAWKDAGVDPSTITYIEAHGTGTPLGDPIEIDGIEGAFKRYTDKKQFCALGSVKSNVGHLDNLAGLVGLVKAILALKNKKIPPTLHIVRPNRKIGFEDSPVYINDKLSKWETDGFPMRCGVSSFGLSGTNCHVILEEAPVIEENQYYRQDSGMHLLTLSAKSKESLTKLVKKYDIYLSQDEYVRLNNMCYTAAVGREHHTHRLAIISDGISGLKDTITYLNDGKIESSANMGTYYNEVCLVARTKIRDGEITKSEVMQLSTEADDIIEKILLESDNSLKINLLNSLCMLYVKGADVNWDRFYSNKRVRKVSLPTYEFSKKQYWIEPLKGKAADDETDKVDSISPLLDKCIAESMNMEIYSVRLSTRQNWELSDHRVRGIYVIPGTAYLEMVKKACARHFSRKSLELRDVAFLMPLALEEGEDRELQIILTKEDNFFKFLVISKVERSNKWIKHTEGKVYRASKVQREYDLDDIKNRCELKEIKKDDDREAAPIELGPRWNTLKRIYLGVNEALGYLELPEEFHDDLDKYDMHPSLMDCAVNIAISHIGQGLYLPFFYKSLKIHGTLPGKIYSHLVSKEEIKDSAEAVSFDISIMDEHGKAIIEVEGYTIKKVHEDEIRFGQFSNIRDTFCEINWLPKTRKSTDEHKYGGPVLVFRNNSQLCTDIVLLQKQAGNEIIEVESGDEFKKYDKDRYMISGTEEDYIKLVKDIKLRGANKIIHIFTVGNKEVTSIEELDEAQKRGTYSLFYLARALAKNKIKEDIDIVVLTDYANEVTKEEKMINPHNNAMIGLCKVINQEHTNLICKLIDIDDITPITEITEEINEKNSEIVVAYRDGNRYVQELSEISIEDIESKELTIKSDGAYIITGGTGGIGIEIGKFLAAENKVNLCLLGRSELPDEEKWDEVIRSKQDIKLISKIEAIKAMRALGAEVEYYCANVSIQERLRDVINQIRKKYGRINGIIHGAGVAGDGFIISKEEEIFSAVMAPKIQGTWLLDKLTEQDEMDFFVMFSSITSIAGLVGQGDYTAANSYLDSFSAYRNKKYGRAVTINWPAWNETGMALDYNIDMGGGVFKSISTKEALWAFGIIMNRDISKVIAGEINYENEIFFNANNDFISLSEQIKQNIIKANKEHNTKSQELPDGFIRDVVLKGRPDDDYSEIERSLSRAWAEVLKLDEVDIYSSFYDLGGDSIIALRLTNIISKYLSIDISISDLFEHLTISRLAEYIDRLDEKKPLAKGYEQEKNLYKDSKNNLSSAQMRIWFLQKYDPDMVAYNLPTFQFVDFNINIDILRDALRLLINRHEAIRTVFREENGRPYQDILGDVEPIVEFVDITDDTHKELVLQQMIMERNRTPFDLSRPLFRLCIFKINEERNCIYFNIHHIITDGWSMDIFFKELMEVYYAYANKKQPVLEPIRTRYLDWVEQQRIWAGSEEYKKVEEYWLSELRKPLPVLNLPIDFKRPQLQTYNGSFVKFEISDEHTEKLKVLSRESKTTLHMTLLSAYFLLLYKISLEKDIIVGVPITGRDDKELEKVFGLFINTLCIRADLDKIGSFKQLLDYIKVKSLNAYKYGKYSFDALVAKINPERVQSRSPILGAMFQFYDNIPPENDGISQYELSLLSYGKGGKIEARLEYNTDLFKRETIERFVKYYLYIIIQICSNPNENLDDIDILLPDDKESLISRFSNVDEVCLSNIPVHRMFELQVRKTPHAQALSYGKESMTYTQLNQKANQLAGILRKEGVQLEEPVGVMVHRGVETVVAILGILKAGGTYVPLDPSYPSARISYMLKHSDARMLITEGQLDRITDLTSGENNLKVIVDIKGGASWKVDDKLHIYKPEHLSNEPTENMPIVGNAGSLMYIIYTSGSTGLPKGVMVTHSNAANFINWSIRHFGLNSNDQMMLVTSINFDISVFEIFGALLSGACLNIVSDEMLKDTGLLLNYIEERKINIWHSVPTLMAQMLLFVKARSEKRHLESLGGMRHIMIGGEAWNMELAKEIRGYFTNAEITNMYGPTEATIWVTSYTASNNLDKTGVVPIGKPIANNKIIILGSNMKLCGIGIPGDIYVSGANVARGYYKDDEKTKNVFLNNHGEIIYKTGDIGRYLDDGNIEYLGRNDGMVKIRGYRIELGEIENVVAAKEGIDDVAVVIKKTGDSDILLCYYVSAKVYTSSEMRKFASLRLPDYMLPSFFIKLEKLPLTPNGKIDKNSLSKMDIEERQLLVNEYIEPTTEAEEFLADIWRKLLNTKNVGIYDSFFDLGGNSFLVTQMHSMIESKYPGMINIVDIFNHPTVDKLIKHLSEKEGMNSVKEEKQEKFVEDKMLDLINQMEDGDASIEDIIDNLYDLEV